MKKKKVIKQILITPTIGKKLIAKAVAELPEVKNALQNKTVVIIAGTTNGFVAEEILNKIGQDSDFSRENFYRGITFPPDVNKNNKFYNKEKFPGDVIINQGEWKKGKTIHEVADDLEEGDIIFKGANALNLETKTAGIYIGDPKGGTINKALQAVVGRRTKLYLPIGLEKRVYGNINKIAKKINNPQTSGPRMMVVNGEVITEIEAINILTGANAELVAAGGVDGAEGSYYLAVSGEKGKVKKSKNIIKQLYND